MWLVECGKFARNVWYPKYCNSTRDETIPKNQDSLINILLTINKNYSSFHPLLHPSEPHYGLDFRETGEKGQETRIRIQLQSGSAQC